MRVIMAMVLLFGISGCSVMPVFGEDDGYLMHVVLIWLKEPGNPDHRQQLIQSSRVLGEIPGVRDLRVGEVVEGDRDVVRDDYDVGIVLRFANAEALASYLAHPLHVNTVKTRFLPIIERYEVMDFQGR